MRKIHYILWALVIVSLFQLYGCESSTVEPVLDEAGWVAKGWDAIVAEDYENAHIYFNNALKIDGTYAPAYNGDGWAYIREQDPEGALDIFQNGFLFAGDLPDTDPHKRMLYIGLMVALYTLDQYDGAVEYGRVYSDLMDPGMTFEHPYIDNFTGYDAYLYLAFSYFAMGDETNVTWAINKLSAKVSLPDWTFTNWEECAAKIDQLIAADPS